MKTHIELEHIGIMDTYLVNDNEGNKKLRIVCLDKSIWEYDKDTQKYTQVASLDDI